MTGKQKVKAAFAKDGSKEIAAVICYDGIYYRDHWKDICSYPFEGMMVMIGENPELVKYVCERYSMYSINRIQQAAALGAEVIWIEECFVDMISPDAYKELNVPYMTRLVEAIREAGMKSIYYYTGNPAKKIEHILSVGADALALKESKKGFEIDIEDLVDAVQGRCTLFGNLDAINLLPQCTDEELKDEIKRQIAAGRRNKSKFIMSIGSPVTPETSPARVRLYCGLVHELGKF